MGKNNRQRRAAKNRKRANRNRQRGRAEHRTRRAASEPAPTWEPPPATDDQLFFAACLAQRTGDDELLAIGLDRLLSRPTRRLTGAIQRQLELQISHLWTGGWQPADLDRVVSRELGAGESTILRCVLAAEAAGYETLGARVAPHWMGQLDRVGATRWWDPKRSYLSQVDSTLRDAVLASVRLMDLLGAIPELPMLTPPPSEWHETMTAERSSNLPPGLLDKVRGLLAKAESTTFDAEAESLTAKAQELMARHRIDRAVLQATARGPKDAPVGRRLAIDDPYAEAKAALLAAISDANGGRTVWTKPLGFSTVFAFVDELDAIEELFTSLLVQATDALRREGSKQDRFGRSRTTRFRRSFLVAFASRIGHRLRETVDLTVADAQSGSDDALLPILAARDDEVDDAADRAFPDIDQFSPSANDREGWYAGTLFGDQADMSLGEKLDERVA